MLHNHLYIWLQICSISEYSEKNLMTIANLGVCFGPTLLRPREETLANIMDIKWCNLVIEVLIDQYDKVSLNNRESLVWCGYDIYSGTSDIRPPMIEAQVVLILWWSSFWNNIASLVYLVVLTGDWSYFCCGG